MRRSAVPRPASLRPSCHSTSLRRAPLRRQRRTRQAGGVATQALACWALSQEGLAAGQRLAACLAEAPWAAPGDGSIAVCHLFAPARICAQMDARENSTPSDAGARPFARFSAILARNFRRYRAHIIIGAAGIAVRALAPLLRHKSEDAPVVVLDAAGRFVVSLLSGHWGGGNNLARHVARLLQAQPVITTASDATEDAPPALDSLARAAGLRILDWEHLPRVAAALLEGEAVPLQDPLCCLPEAGAPRFRRGATQAAGHIPLVAIHWKRVAPAPDLLRLVAPRLHVGVGCRRGVNAAAIHAAVLETLTEYGLEPAALADIATVAEKADEPGLAETTRRLGVPLRAFTALQLAGIPVPHPSAAAGERFDLPPFSVCEGAALLAARKAQPDGRAILLAPKTVFAGRVTVAIALSAAPEGEE